MLGDTIAAISTPPGEGAIALVRLSGPQAVAVAAGMFEGRVPVERMEARRQYYGRVHDAGQAVDQVLLSVHRAPASYTGEEVVEIAGHGGVLISHRILELALRRGARPAEPGEFTQRAFLHGKMDLTQAEAVMDLITAQTDLALRAAREQLSGRLGEEMRAVREQLLELLAHLEAYIDFPDEDIAPETGVALRRRLETAIATLQRLLATAGRGRWLREGVRTVIYGAPNVGKSSLLNLLLGYERAIVSALPGTTRDTIEETINLRGIPLRLIDTAGVRASADPLEQAGIERTNRQVERADLVLHLYDASAPPPAEEGPAPARALRVLNKLDLGEDPGWGGAEAVRISCRDGRGVEALEEAILRHLQGAETGERDWGLAINARHQHHLEEALRNAEAARLALDRELPPELLAEELRAALAAVGEVVGRVDTEEVLGKIFSTFCIGK